MAGSVTHKVLMENSPPAPPTSGNLFAPMMTGTGVKLEIRDAMPAKDQQLKR